MEMKRSSGFARIERKAFSFSIDVMSEAEISVFG